MDDVKQDTLYEKYWLPMEKDHGENQLKNFIRHFLEYKEGEFVTPTEIYHTFKNYYIENNYTNESMLR